MEQCTLWASDFERQVQWQALCERHPDRVRIENDTVRIKYLPETTMGANGSKAPHIHQSFLFSDCDECTLEYEVMFHEGWAFGIDEIESTGKLPGLAPETLAAGGSAVAPGAWSVRPTWRYQRGAAELYIYDQDRAPQSWGRQETGKLEYKIGCYQKIALHVKLNTAAKVHDGLAELHVDGVCAMRADNLRLRANTDAPSRIRKIIFETFYGGTNGIPNPKIWCPPQETYASFRNFKIVAGVSNSSS